MVAKSYCLNLNTERAPQFIDITDWVSRSLAEKCTDLDCSDIIVRII